MGRKKKPAKELDTGAAVKRLFPGKVVKTAKKVAHERDAQNGQKSKKKG